MVNFPEHISWATALRLTANLLTACTALGWMRFADCRQGVLSSPNLHHRVYLRILVTLSCLAYVATLLSLAATAHAASGKGVHEQSLQRHIAKPDEGYPVAPLTTSTDAQEETAGDAEADAAER